MADPRPVGPTCLFADLTPTMRRQDHTTSPYASAPPVRTPRGSLTSPKSPPCHPIARTPPPRPPHPIPTFVTMANAPSLGTGYRSLKGDLPDDESGILPVGLFCRRRDRHQVRFAMHSGLKSDIAARPKRAKSGSVRRSLLSAPPSKSAYPSFGWVHAQKSERRRLFELGCRIAGISMILVMTQIEFTDLALIR